MDNKQILLIVEDDPGLQKQLKWSFTDYQVVIAGNRDDAIAAVRMHRPDVVTLDLGLPPDPANASVGLETLREILQLSPTTKVVVVTGNDDRDNAVSAVAMGAYDFYQKPVDSDVLALIVGRAFQLVGLEKAYQCLKQTVSEPLTGIIASCKAMQDIARMVEKVAPTNATTLLLGESGTGKEVFAKALHHLSLRANQPFVAVNCAAIPENLLESELFGYEKGAFTGASQLTKGKIEFADKGTFFLDEIGDLPIALQAKLLRFLQERAVERLGGRKPIPVDVRIVCATHQDLDSLIERGKFRLDLYYRVSEISITIPALREREGDAVMIATALLKRFNEAYSKRIKGFSNDALMAIENYSWPGNIREMENKVKRAVILTDDGYLTAYDLELPPSNQSHANIPFNLKAVREEAESTAIKKALLSTNNNISKAAKMLGVTRPTLYGLLEKYEIKAGELNRE